MDKFHNVGPAIRRKCTEIVEAIVMGGLIKKVFKLALRPFVRPALERIRLIMREEITNTISADGYLNLMKLAGNVVISDYKYTPKVRPSFPASRIGKIIIEDFELNKEHIVKCINIIKKFAMSLRSIALTERENSVRPQWINDWIPPIDGAMLYSTLASMNPRYYIECGSGNTTKFAAAAISDHALRTKIISIDPCPRAEIDLLCDEIFRLPFEEMDLSFFKRLTSEDVFVLDNSHRVLPNSDVTVFFTEVLPDLPPGLIYALHDIALPDEIYSERYYSEQYMLATYMIGGMANDKIYFPTGFLSNHTILLHELTQELQIHNLPFYNYAGFFWMVKG